MMYESKMALAVKTQGRVLRENKDTVYLPFGCEYSLLIKNLNSVRALVKVWIDGTDVTDGTSGLIVEPNASIDLERFIKNGNLSGGNKFKFIERTAKVSKHRGNKVDDGLIRVEFEFEQQRQPRPRLDFPIRPTWTINSYHSTDAARGLPDTWLQSNASASASAGNEPVTASYSATSADFNLRSATKGKIKSASAPETEVGITVPGAVSDQQFTWGAWFPTDGVKHSMVLRMLGEVEGQQVQAPITVQKRKVDCPSCGTRNKTFAKFCSECGTGLEIV